MTSSPDTRRFERLRELFELALPLDAMPRAALLADVAAGDGELGAALRELLDAHAAHSGHTGEQRQHIVGLASDVLGAGTADSGARIGPYELREELGRGGMGVVFRAERVDGKVKQDVAIKIVNRALLGPRALERFRLEREIVAGFEHPSIARLYDVGETADGSPCMIMERIDGAPITVYADRHELSIRARLELFLKVCEAVQHAHARLVLHRDLKPSNILVTTEGTPKLIDFGIAKLIVETGEATGTHERFFSPSNAAPEQMRGERVGVACDVYQLGTVLYELLCGSEVFEMAPLRPAEVEQRILSHVPTAPSQRAVLLSPEKVHARAANDARSLVRQLHGDLDNIALHALRKAPAERYASVEQLSDDVRNYLAQRPIAARRGQRGYRLRKFVRRNLAALLLGMVAVTAVVGFIATILLQSARLERERDTARAERDRADKGAQFLIDVFTSADPSQALGRDLPIGKVVDAARAKLEKALSDEPQLRARLLGVLANVYQNLGDSTTALELLEQATAVLDASEPLDDRAMIEFLVTSSDIRNKNNQLDPAADAARQAVSIHERLHDPPGQQWKARFAVLMAILPRRDVSEWRAPFLALLRDMEADPAIDPADIAFMRYTVGHNLSFNYDYAEAEALIRQAFDYFVVNVPPNHPNLIGTQIALANVLDRTGKSAESAALYEAVLEVQQQLHGEQSFRAADIMGRLGEALRRAGRYDEALLQLEAARTIMTKPGAQPDQLMTVNMKIADTLRDVGRLDEAERIFIKIISDQVPRTGPRSPNVLTNRYRLGLVHALQGRLVEAEADFAEALRDAEYKWAANAYWAIEHAEVLHRLGRDAEAAAVLDRMQPLLEKYREHLAPIRARRDKLADILHPVEPVHREDPAKGR